MFRRPADLRIFTLFWLTLFGAPVTLYCSTTSDYRARIEAANKSVTTMIAIVKNDGSGDDVDDFLRQKVAEIKKTVPETERIDTGGTSFDTSNAWLKTELDKLSEYSESDRTATLTAVSERLASIDARVRELEEATASDRSKDQDKQKLNEILNREEYKKPEQKEESLFQRWAHEFLDWLFGIWPRPNITPVDPSGLQPLSVLLQILIYGAVIGAVGFLVYKFAPVLAARFRHRERAESSSRVVLGEHIDASVSASDLFAQAEALARNGDLRGAIRRGYIALLCDLADKKVVGLARHKTNRDYLREMRKHSGLFIRMKNATGSFERHWYGFRTPAPNDWEEIREQYRSALNEA